MVDGGAHWALLEARVAEDSEAGVAQLLDAAPWAGGRLTGRTVSASAAEWLVPAEASKVVAIGQNYRRHAAELGKPVPAEPLLFLKPSTANAHPRPIVLPEASGEVHYEAELALVIGRTLTRVDERGARDGIFGVTCFNDVTARDLQRREVQHTRAKGYDTFACCGPSRGLAYDDLRVSSRSERRATAGRAQLGHGVWPGDARGVHLARDDVVFRATSSARGRPREWGR